MEGSKSARTIAPEPADLVVRARALIPVLARRSLEQKQRRGILPETIAEMQAAGFFRVLQPRRWGGYEMNLGTFYDIEMALSEGDMSSGWTYGVLGVVSWFLGVMDDRAAQEVWGHDTTTLICSSTMPAGKATAVDGATPAAASIAAGHCSAAWCMWIAPRPIGAFSWCRAGITRPSTRGRSPAFRAPAAST